jgi:DNA-binding beta-propeller fold protein YncE
VTPPAPTSSRYIVKTGSGKQSLPAALPPHPDDTSLITVIDPEKDIVLGQVLLSGHVDSAQGDGSGQLYLTVTDRDRILRIDESTVIRMLVEAGGEDKATLDWSDGPPVPHEAGYSPAQLALSSVCTEPKGLAVDGRRQRLFVTCGNGKLTVWNPAHGELVATLPIAAAATEVVFDSERNLLFAANGSGSLTIVRQHLADDYTVVQDLPTPQQARTLALNPATGEVYLVTNELGYDLSKPGGIGKLHPVPIRGSFQVLVVGN